MTQAPLATDAMAQSIAPEDKIDFKKTLDSYQAKRGVFRLVEVPPLHYLMIDGHGDPNTSPAFAEAIETLYPIAYKLKFASNVKPFDGLSEGKRFNLLARFLDNALVRDKMGIDLGSKPVTNLPWTASGVDTEVFVTDPPSSSVPAPVLPKC